MQDRYGSPSDLRCVDLPVPRIGDDEVLVRVRAASVHPDVWHVVTGRPVALRLMGGGVRRPKQPVPGTDFAGEVVAVGADVTTVRVGDDVFGETLPSMQWVNGATWAELVAVQQDRLLAMPAGLTHEQACTLPTAGIIALQAVREQARVSPGQQVLVNGAAGGVGSLAVQVARADGATVTAVDGPDKQDLLRDLGADHVVDFTREDFTRGDRRYDVIVDIPGNHPFSDISRALAPHGRYVLVGHDQYGREGRRLLGSIPRMVGLMARSVVTDQVARGSFHSRPKIEYLRALAELAEAGQVRPVVGRSFALEEATAAIEHLASGRAVGRVVLTTTDGADPAR